MRARGAAKSPLPPPQCPCPQQRALVLVCSRHLSPRALRGLPRADRGGCREWPLCRAHRGAAAQGGAPAAPAPSPGSPSSRDQGGSQLPWREARRTERAVLREGASCERCTAARWGCRTLHGSGGTLQGGIGSLSHSATASHCVTTTASRCVATTASPCARPERPQLRDVAAKPREGGPRGRPGLAPGQDVQAPGAAAAAAASSATGFVSPQGGVRGQARRRDQPQFSLGERGPHTRGPDGGRVRSGGACAAALPIAL